MKQALKDIAETMHRAVPSVPFAIDFWDGDAVRFGGRPQTGILLKSPGSLKDLLTKGFLGFGEAFMDGDIEVYGDFQELLHLGLAINFDESGVSLRQKFRFLRYYLEARNTPDRARDNVMRHYGRSNDFYALFLDPTMTYSCGYFRNEDDTLEQAQCNKYDHIARKLMLREGETLVDVGCGWGGMLIHAAQTYGIKGLGDTLSQNQYEYAGRKIRELGLAGRIEVVPRDYRELAGVFDKFVSIGMFEHVGKKYIPIFMSKAAGLLKKGGLGLLHTISKDVESPAEEWMLRYIFPGGYIPTLPEIAREMGRAGLFILDVENLRMHYAMTLDRWIANFEKNADRVREMYGEKFVRMWRLYLNASSAGFKWGETRLYQILFSNGLNNGLPLTREYIYPDSGSHAPSSPGIP